MVAGIIHGRSFRLAFLFSFSAFHIYSSFCANILPPLSPSLSVGNIRMASGARAASPTDDAAIDSDSAVVSQGDFGSLILCPAGGKSFRMAWSLACEMRRKRKRSIDHQSFGKNLDQNMFELQQKRQVPQGYRPATLTDIQKICCNVGCEIRDLLSYCDPFGPWNS
uniref:Insulin-like domain-containing protein n=1 Tax=Romanomermis culicivorax TaxID=13658 RepID=A0A915IWI7_ROMCU